MNTKDDMKKNSVEMEKIYNLNKFKKFTMPKWINLQVESSKKFTVYKLNNYKKFTTSK
jgi:hypothetical protein